jgi:hypothetical protein
MPAITAKVGTLPDGTMGFDTVTPLTPATAASFLGQGFGFVVRYVGRGDGSKVFKDITLAEAQTIVDAGLALCLVQHPLNPGWSPNMDKGNSFGAAAAAQATAAGLLPGTSVFADLEGVASTAVNTDVIAFCNAWFDQVSGAGFTPGIYIGAAPGLTADELYWDIKMKSYWRGGSSASSGVPEDIPNRGYQLTQRITGSGATEFDSDVVKTDNFGGAVQWCVSA